jgi:hypothetical protein
MRFDPFVIAALLTIPPGELVQLVIRHDDGCPALEGGPCTCRPDLEIRRTAPQPEQEN